MTDLPQIIPTAQRALLAAALVCGLVAWAVSGAAATWGVLAGAAFAAANLQALGWLGGRLVTGDASAKQRAALLLALKLAAACGVLVALLVVLKVPPLALLAGVTLGPAGLLLASMARAGAR